MVRVGFLGLMRAIKSMQTRRQLADAQVSIQSLREQLAASPQLDKVQRLDDESQKLLELLMVAPCPEEFASAAAHAAGFAPREKDLNALKGQMPLLTAQLPEARDEENVKPLEEAFSSLEREFAHLRDYCNSQADERQEFERMLAAAHSATEQRRQTIVGRNGKLRELQAAVSQAAHSGWPTSKTKNRCLEAEIQAAHDVCAVMEEERILREVEALAYAVARRAEEMLEAKQMRKEIEPVEKERDQSNTEIEILAALRTARDHEDMKKLRAEVHEAKRSTYPLKKDRDCLVYAKDVVATLLRQAVDENSQLAQTDQIAQYKKLLEARNGEILKLVCSRSDPVQIQETWQKLGERVSAASQQARQMQVQLARGNRARKVERIELDNIPHSRGLLADARRRLIIRLKEAEEGWEKYHQLRCQPLGRPAAGLDKLDNAADAAKLQAEPGRFR
ncbi:MAG: hypothetical protein M1826_007296 [Phylliscum demangeonii]|nr:MAG: hypothetical protein M1826_007296 [Phylliscum demangeonii]